MRSGNAGDRYDGDVENRDDILEVYWAPDAHEAHLVCGLLEEAGIKARVVGEMLQSAAGELPPGPTIAPRVWVLASDEIRAREVIATWEERRKAARTEDPPAMWACPNCSESVDGTFDICWNCQTQRPM